MLKETSDDRVRNTNNSNKNLTVTQKDKMKVLI